MSRRCRKSLLIALMALNFSSPRGIIVSHACEPSRVFFSSSQSLKCLARMLVRPRQHLPSRHALASSSAQRSSFNIIGIRRDSRTAPITVLQPASLALKAGPYHARHLYAWKLPADLHPVQPPPLLSRK